MLVKVSSEIIPFPAKVAVVELVIAAVTAEGISFRVVSAGMRLNAPLSSSVSSKISFRPRVLSLSLSPFIDTSFKAIRIGSDFVTPASGSSAS